MTESQSNHLSESAGACTADRAQVPAWFLAAGIIALIGLDQATKLVAIATLMDSPPIIFAGDLFRLQYAENQGAFLSLGANLPDGARFLLLTVFNVGIIGVMSYLLVFRRPAHPAVAIALTCIIAGGIGNLIDRVFRDGVVIDFMNVGIGSLRSGIFNIADLAIVAGFVLFVCFGHKASEPAG
jgi:signal peptidase II